MEEKSMSRIDIICCTAAALTDDDFSAMEQRIADQREYDNPILASVTKWQHDLADFNERVLQKVRELKAAIDSGNAIVEPTQDMPKILKVFESEETNNGTDV